MARKPTSTQPAKSLANDEDRKAQALFTHNKSKYKRLLDAKKQADADLRNFGKTIKSDHGDYGLDMIKLSIKMEKPEGTAEAKQRLLETARVLRWEGIPIGFQDDLFASKDTRSLDELAYEAGRRAALGEESMTAPTEYAAGEVYQQWCKGWHDGQTEIFDIKKGGGKPAETEDEVEEETDPRDEAPRDPNVVFGNFKGGDATEEVTEDEDDDTVIEGEEPLAEADPARKTTEGDAIN